MQQHIQHFFKHTGGFKFALVSSIVLQRANIPFKSICANLATVPLTVNIHSHNTVHVDIK